MFRRRSRSRHQPLSTVPSQSAQSAASHAFLKSQPSSSSLSSAAAAAALRSLTPTPTPVENVQTKRMMQRRASVTSQTSRTGSLRSDSRTALRRSNSSSSMSNRTFREQSPRRPASSNGQVDVVPPLPSIPPGIAGRKNSGRRSVSLEPSVRFDSSPKHKTLGRGTSVDRSLRSSSSYSPIQSQKLCTVPELERTGSRNSINFSYPMTSRPTSPTVSRQFPTQPEALTNVSLNHELSPAGSPNARAAKNQETRKAAGLVAGSPGRNASSVGTAVAAAQAAVVPKSDGTGHSPVVNRFVNHREATTNIHGKSQDLRQVSSHRMGPKLAPAVPEEDCQGEERAGPDGIGSSFNHPRAGSVSPIDDAVSNSLEHLYAAEPSIIRTPATPDEKDARPTYPVQSTESNESPRSENGLQQSPIRYSSSSPGRSARFSSQLAVTGIAEHQPPPRSVSPVKSALKNARKSSLSPNGRNGSVIRPGPSLSELSDATSVASDDGSRLGYRRKPVKVSFDDDTEIVGVAASPPTSPEELTPEPPEKFRARTGWFGIGKRQTSQRDTVDPDEFDEVLKPRPALPSFGSIRGRREDEPEPAQPDFSDNESTASSEFDGEVSGWSVSNDRSVRGILSEPSVTNDQSGTEVDRIAVTESTEDANDQTNNPLSQDSELVHEPMSLASQAPKTSVADAHSMREQEPLMTPDVELALQGRTTQTTSPGTEKGRSSLEIYRVPGGFPRASLELDSRATNKRKGKRRSGGMSVDEDMPNGKESDGESGESVYSDAEEVVDGDGFGSINAIVDARIAQGKDGRPADSLTGIAFSKDDRRGIGAKSKNGTANRLEESSQADRAATPVQEARINAKAAESPTCQQECLPSSRPDLPSPAQSTVQSQATAKAMHPAPRASQAKRPMSTAVYNDSGLRGAVATDGSLRDLSGNGTSALRRDGSERAKKRPVSFGPVIQKEIDPAPSSERAINSRTPYMPQRRMSAGSDSSSSFIRSTRRGKKGGQHTMRLTMRLTMRAGPPIRAMPPSPGRTSSPSFESRPLSSGSGTGTMRTTLRSSGPKNDKPSTFFSARSQKSKATKTTTPRFVSRFPDSDDEDADFRQRKLQRRYDDSSGDEEGRVVHTLRPVRGIPRRQGTNDGDSTELEDSSENERPTTPAPAAVSKKPNPLSHDPGLAAVARSRGMTEEELDEFLHRPAKGRVSGILGRFTLKKSRPPMEHKVSKSNPEDLAHVREENLLNPVPGTTVTTVTANHSATSPAKLTKGGLKKANENGGPMDSKRRGSDAAADAGTVAEQHPVAAGASEDRSASIEGHSEPTARDTAYNTQSSEAAPPREEQHLADANGNNRLSAKDVVFPQAERKKRFPPNLDFDARVPIPFSVFPSSYRSDAVPETTLTRVEGEVNLDRTSHVEREDTRTSAPLPNPRVYGREEVDIHITKDRLPAPSRKGDDFQVIYEDRSHKGSRAAEVELARERYREPTSRYEPRKPVYDQALESQLDITEREYRRRTDPTYDVSVSYGRRPVDSYQAYQPQQTSDVSVQRSKTEIDVSYDKAFAPKPLETQKGDSFSRREFTVESVSSRPSSAASISQVKVLKPYTAIDQPPARKMGYYDDDGNYHSFRRGVERAVDRITHPFSHHHHHHHDREEVVMADERGPVRYRDGVREDVRIVEPRTGGVAAESVPIPCHFIRIGDILILQGRPCQVIRISVSPQTGQHRYLGVDLFTRQLQEESSFVSNPSPSVVVQTMLGPVYKTYRILDLHEDGSITAMTETGDVKQSLPVVTQGQLFRKIREAFSEGRGSVRALVINDGGRELVVDYKVIHGSRL
ncbi:hypothetical protein CNMCM5793_001495 [Aspergillus hiratsukae]|uniref:Woronin body major protein n=1 Tax=Aspergillus hiratsukae TaxID=1194566 RepID=A0A8H6UFZ1_9EURO|nr:hypothetical protein CNMCM5793_001495 [Aspergillus hiratsukae]